MVEEPHGAQVLEVQWIQVKVYKVAQVVWSEVMRNRCRDKRVLVRLVETVAKRQELSHMFRMGAELSFLLALHKALGVYQFSSCNSNL